MATETFWCPGFWPWEWTKMCTREIPDPADPCNAAACVDAKKRLDEARKRFNRICVGVQTLRAIEKLLLPLSETSWTKLATWAIIAIIAQMIGGTIVAAVIWAAILAVGISKYLVIVIGATMARLMEPLDRARNDVQRAFLEVLAACPAQCRGDMTVPECKLE